MHSLIESQGFFQQISQRDLFDLNDGYGAERDGQCFMHYLSTRIKYEGSQSMSDP